jgi:hypothetical protein
MPHNQSILRGVGLRRDTRDPFPFLLQGPRLPHAQPRARISLRPLRGGRWLLCLSRPDKACLNISPPLVSITIYGHMCYN